VNVYDVSLLLIEGDQLLATFVDAPPGESDSVNADAERAALKAWADKVREYMPDETHGATSLDRARHTWTTLFNQADRPAPLRWVRDANPHFTYTRHTLESRLDALRLFILDESRP
jgi:hypothetical protein